MPGDGNIANIGDLAKPVDSLINKLADAVGVLFEPSKIVRKAKADAQADEIRAIAELKIDEMRKRTLQRVLNEETKKQENIESVIENSIPLIRNDSNPNSIDNDWLASMLEKAKLVSNDQMRVLWGKILAGEVNNNGSFSRKTLSIVADLEMKDAALFTNLCSFSFLIGAPTVIVMDIQNNIYNQYGINFGSLTHLESLGLINFNNLSGFIRQKLPQSFMISYWGRPITIKMPKEKDNDLHIGSVLFTQAGRELCSICEATATNEILDYTLAKWKENGVQIL